MEKPKLNKEQKKNMRKWVKALRSGKYKQTRDTYFKLDGSGGPCYCAVGVANEVLSGNATCCPLYSDVLGFHPIDDCLVYKGREYSVTELNDEQGLSFKQIALRLERTYL